MTSRKTDYILIPTVSNEYTIITGMYHIQCTFPSIPENVDPGHEDTAAMTRPSGQKPVASRPASPAKGPEKEGGLFSKIGNRFNTALQSGRGEEAPRPAPAAPVAATPAAPKKPTEEKAYVRTRGSSPSMKMYIPEGTVVQGSLSGKAETEIHGRVEGNVTVEGALFLGKSAVITGNVKATSCQVDGKVEGSMDCGDELILSEGGSLAADASAGKVVRISGNIAGNVTTPGTLRIEAGGVVNGDVQARVFSMSEGAVLNGRCTMRNATQQDTLFKETGKT